MPLRTLPFLGRLRDRLLQVFGARAVAQLNRAVAAGDFDTMRELMSRVYLASATSAYGMHGDLMTLPDMNAERLAEFGRAAETFGGRAARRARGAPLLSPAWQEAYPDMMIDAGLAQGYEYGAKQAAVHAGEEGWKTWTRIWPAKKPRDWHNALEGVTIERRADFQMPGGPNQGAECEGPHDWSKIDDPAEWMHCGHALVYTPAADWTDVLSPTRVFPVPPEGWLARAVMEAEEGQAVSLRTRIERLLGPGGPVISQAMNPESAELFAEAFESLPESVKEVYRSVNVDTVSRVIFGEYSNRTQTLGSYNFVGRELTFNVPREVTVPQGQYGVAVISRGRTGQPWAVETIVHEAGHAVSQLQVEGRTELDTFARAIYKTPDTITATPGRGMNAYAEVTKNSPELRRAISDYGQTNIHEDFAETYTFYHLDPDGLKRKAPERYAVMDEIVRRRR